MNKTELYKDAKELIEEGGLLGGLQLMEEASDAGSIKATGFLAFGFYVGKNGLPQDYLLAEKYLLRFVEQASPKNPDYAEAHCALGCIYYFGNAGKKDIKKAIIHFKESAELGNLIAESYHSKATDKRDDRRLKWIYMPLIIGVIIIGSALTAFLGWNSTLTFIISFVIVIGLVLLYLHNSKKLWIKEE